MEFKKNPIYCPKCGARVMYHDGITSIPISSKCRFCGCYVMYNPKDEQIKFVKEPPLREGSSGRRFY